MTTKTNNQEILVMRHLTEGGCAHAVKANLQRLSPMGYRCKVCGQTYIPKHDKPWYVELAHPAPSDPDDPNEIPYYYDYRPFEFNSLYDALEFVRRNVTSDSTTKVRNIYDSEGFTFDLDKVMTFNTGERTFRRKASSDLVSKDDKDKPWWQPGYEFKGTVIFEEWAVLENVEGGLGRLHDMSYLEEVFQ